MIRVLYAVLASLLVQWPFGGQARAQAQTDSRPAIRAAALNGDLDLDGLLDEAVWTSADSISSLTQTEPTQGGTSSGRTVVRILVNGDFIVIGIRAHDLEPDRIVSYAKARDASLSSLRSARGYGASARGPRSTV